MSTGLYDLDEYDIRKNKNLYITPDAIDERQSIELLTLLDKWQTQKPEPWDVLLETSFIVGANGTMIDYQVSKKWNAPLYDKLKHGLSEEDKAVWPPQDYESALRHEKSINALKKVIRDEVLDRGNHEASISQNIDDIRSRLETGAFNSWQAATAITEIIIDPKKGKKFRDNFAHRIEMERKECEGQRKDVHKTMARLEPETEASILEPLARYLATERAKDAWIEAEKAAGRKNADDWTFALYGSPGAPKPDEKVEFVSPIKDPGRKLCDQIHIVPSGTGLIEIYPRHADSGFENDIYGTSVARITTYSVSFIPKKTEDLPLLAETVENALKVLADVPYPYDLPGHTRSGESYKRVTNKPYQSSYHKTVGIWIDRNDGKAQPLARFDLDDLWKLYYLLEPVIEANEQVASAMNAARYAEERGAILNPSPHDYVFEGHQVGDRSGYLKDTAAEKLLGKAVRDTFVDLALNKIDEAEFLIRISTIADHTLTGRMHDAEGVLPTYNDMITDARKCKNEVVTYDRAWSDRTKDILRVALGIPADSDVPVHVALRAAIKEVAEPLQKEFRGRDLEEDRAIRAEDERRYIARVQRDREMHERALRGEKVPGIGEHLREQMGKDDFALKFSDLNAGRFDKTFGKAGEDDHDKTEQSSSDMKQRANLVVADSAVETCLDGIHAEGRYRSRTKGSPFVRKELPTALRPFYTPPADRPVSQIMLQAPEKILG